MPRYKYDSAIELAYSRAHRAENRANKLGSKSGGSPRNATLHRHAAKMYRVAARLYMKTSKYDSRRAREAAKAMLALAIWHDGFAKRIDRNEMGAPGSIHEMSSRVRGFRDRRRRRTRRSSRRRSYR